MFSIITPTNIVILFQSHWWIGVVAAVGIVSYLIYRIVDWLQARYVKNASRPLDLEQLTEEIYLDKRKRKYERSVGTLWKTSISWLVQGTYVIVGIPAAVYLLARYEISYGNIYFILIAVGFVMNMLLSKMFTLWTPSRPFACRDFRGDKTWRSRNMAFQAWGLLIWTVPTYFCWNFYQMEGWAGTILFLVIGQIVQVFVFIFTIKQTAIPYQEYSGLSDNFKRNMHEYLQKQGLRDNEVAIMPASEMGPNAFATSLLWYRQIILTEELVKGYTDPGNPKFTLKLGDDTLEAIASHEMGHIKHHDVEKGMILGILLTSAVTIAVYYLFAGYPEQYLLFKPGTSQQLILFWGESIFNVMLLYPLTCFMMFFKRVQEYGADKFMLETNGHKNGHLFFHQMRHIAPVENHPAWHSLNMTHPPAEEREERIRKWQEEHPLPKP